MSTRVVPTTPTCGTPVFSVSPSGTPSDDPLSLVLQSVSVLEDVYFRTQDTGSLERGSEFASKTGPCLSFSAFLTVCFVPKITVSSKTLLDLQVVILNSYNDHFYLILLDSDNCAHSKLSVQLALPCLTKQDVLC